METMKTITLEWAPPGHYMHLTYGENLMSWYVHIKKHKWIIIDGVMEAAKNGHNY